MNYKEKLPYVGDSSQLFGYKEYRLMGGRSDGMRCIDIKNGKGLEFTIVADRCMDITYLSFKGQNYGWISAAGVASPAYFDDKNDGFLRNFTGGFLTTAGLSNIGAPCEDGGEKLGLHGRIDNTPAEQVCVCYETENDIPVIKIKGVMREAKPFGENLILTREITVSYGTNIIALKDTIENKGFIESPIMLLYHFNMGYPLLSENAKIIIPSKEVKPKNDHAADGLDNWMNLQPPTDNYEEMCFYHNLKTDANNSTAAALYNPDIKSGIMINFDKNMLDNFVEWKMMGKSNYVLGLEPCNARIAGRVEEQSSGRLKTIKPGEKLSYSTNIRIIENINYINEYMDKLN